MRLVEALQDANKDFELMIYPSSRHGIFGPHYTRLQLDFIRRTLGEAKPEKPSFARRRGRTSQETTPRPSRRASVPDGEEAGGPIANS